MVLSDWVGILKAFFTLLKANVKKSSSFLGSRCIIKSISEERRRCEFPHSQGENLASKDPLFHREEGCPTQKCLGDVALLSLGTISFSDAPLS